MQNPKQTDIEVPFTPGVGLEPKYLAGRQKYILEYEKRLGAIQLQQKNTLAMGLRGVGKSVLLKTLARHALEKGWIPVVRELSRRSNHEDELIQGLLGEVALRLKGVTISRTEKSLGIGEKKPKTKAIGIEDIQMVFRGAAGDKGDKLLAVFQTVSNVARAIGASGLVLMLDEFQLLEDHEGQYCLTLILDTLSKLQSSTDVQIHAVLAGLPTMLSKMAESKPHAERLFSNIIDLGTLDSEESRKAIVEPLRLVRKPNLFAKDLVDFIVKVSEGYPFFIQYFSDAAFSNFQHAPIKKSDFEKILPEIYSKLDEHFYTPRFSLLSGRERAVTLASVDLPPEFTPTELLEALLKKGAKVTMGTTQQYLLKLQQKNIFYKIRRGTYSYALPFFSRFLKRCLEGGEDPSETLKDLGTD